jgi:hypothetical protein
MNEELLEADFQRELAMLEAESLGWTPLEPGVYLHVSDVNVTEVLVVAVAPADMQTANLIWVY